MKLRLLDKLHFRIGKNYMFAPSAVSWWVWYGTIHRLLLLSDTLHMQLAGENGTMCLSVYH